MEIKHKQQYWALQTFDPVYRCDKSGLMCANCPCSRSDEPGELVGKNPLITYHDSLWSDPLAWEQECKTYGARQNVFVGNMSNWADDDWSPKNIRRLWKLISRTPNLDWELLTKHADNIERHLPKDWGAGYPNVALGVSVESSEHSQSIEILRGLPAAKRFVQFGKLAPIAVIAGNANLASIDWVFIKSEQLQSTCPLKYFWKGFIENVCREQGVKCFPKGKRTRR